MEETNLRFANSWRPALGNERIRLKITESNEVFPQSFTEELELDGFSNPLQLREEDLYSLYPPLNATGDFNHVLPHIVLKRYCFCWERNREQRFPWVALLLFAEGEAAAFKETTIGEAVKQESGLYNPFKAGEEFGADEKCKIVDVEASLFTRVMPTKKELDLLAHVRMVNLDNKVTDASVKDSSFAAVVSNRFPKLGADFGDDFKRFRVVLVSLLGFEDYINGEEKALSEAEKSGTIRLYELFSWTYTCAKQQFDFKTLVEDISLDALCAEAGKGGKKLKEIMSLGYYPLNHRTRDGAKTVSFYRGPLIPCGVRYKRQDSQSFGDGRLKYDPYYGVFDVSYAAAWSLGKLLAVKDGAFSRAVVNWRRNAQSAVKVNWYNELVSGFHQGTDTKRDFLEALKNTDRLGDAK